MATKQDIKSTLTLMGFPDNDIESALTDYENVHGSNYNIDWILAEILQMEENKQQHLDHGNTANNNLPVLQRMNTTEAINSAIDASLQDMALKDFKTLTQEQKSNLITFIDVTEAKPEPALKFLRNAKWDMQVAMDKYLNNPGANIQINKQQPQQCGNCGYTLWVQRCGFVELRGYYQCIGEKNDRYHFKHRQHSLAQLYADDNGYWCLIYNGKLIYKSKKGGDTDPPPFGWHCIGRNNMPPPGIDYIALADKNVPMVTVPVPVSDDNKNKKNKFNSKHWPFQQKRVEDWSRHDVVSWILSIDDIRQKDKEKMRSVVENVQLVGLVLITFQSGTEMEYEYGKLSGLSGAFFNLLFKEFQIAQEKQPKFKEDFLFVFGSESDKIRNMEKIASTNPLKMEEKEDALSAYDGYINKYGHMPQNATHLMKFSKMNNKFAPLLFKEARSILAMHKNKNTSKASADNINLEEKNKKRQVNMNDNKVQVDEKINKYNDIDGDQEWRYKKMKKWNNMDIINWIKSMKFEKKWNDKLLEEIKNCQCTGKDMRALKTAQDVAGSFDIFENENLCNDLCGKIRNFKAEIKGQIVDDDNKTFKINIFSQQKHFILKEEVTKNETVQYVKVLYKIQCGINTNIDDIHFYYKRKLLEPQKTLEQVNITDGQHLISVMFGADGAQ